MFHATWTVLCLFLRFEHRNSKARPCSNWRHPTTAPTWEHHQIQLPSGIDLGPGTVLWGHVRCFSKHTTGPVALRRGSQLPRDYSAPGKVSDPQPQIHHLLGPHSSSQGNGSQHFLNSAAQQRDWEICWINADFLDVMQTGTGERNTPHSCS